MNLCCYEIGWFSKIWGEMLLMGPPKDGSTVKGFNCITKVVGFHNLNLGYSYLLVTF
jgi:hypothetical protein